MVRVCQVGRRIPGVKVKGRYTVESEATRLARQLRIDNIINRLNRIS